MTMLHKKRKRYQAVSIVLIHLSLVEVQTDSVIVFVMLMDRTLVLEVLIDSFIMSRVLSDSFIVFTLL